MPLKRLVFFSAVVAGMIMFLSCGTSFAQSTNVKTLVYKDTADEPTYQAAWLLMQEMLIGSLYDQKRSSPDRPYLKIADFDLNSDGIVEHIAFLVEADHEIGVYCKNTGALCPHYIFSGTKGKTTLLGKIYAESLDVGDDVVNGYKSLKSFTMERDGMIYPESFIYYETYTYQPEQGEYENVLVKPEKEKK